MPVGQQLEARGRRPRRDPLGINAPRSSPAALTVPESRPLPQPPAPPTAGKGTGSKGDHEAPLPGGRTHAWRAPSPTLPAYPPVTKAATTYAA
jgi:hypothetical protein